MGVRSESEPLCWQNGQKHERQPSCVCVHSVVSDSLEPHRLCSLPGSSVQGTSQARILESESESVCCSVVLTLCCFFFFKQYLIVFIYFFNFDFFSFTLFYFTILCWFCHTLTRIHHGCIHAPNPESPSHLPPHIITLDH